MEELSLLLDEASTWEWEFTSCFDISCKEGVLMQEDTKEQPSMIQEPCTIPNFNDITISSIPLSALPKEASNNSTTDPPSTSNTDKPKRKTRANFSPAEVNLIQEKISLKTVKMKHKRKTPIYCDMMFNFFIPNCSKEPAAK